MPFDDLDLEFEDEEETKKKKNEAFHVDVDLEFQAPEGVKRPQPAPRPAVSAREDDDVQAPPTPIVRKIDDARAAQVKKPVPQSPTTNQPPVMGSSALKVETNSDAHADQILEMRDQMRKIQFEADVKVQVADFKVQILSEMLSDIKLMDHHIGQLLVRIINKHPDIKNEALMIKKILADFTAKKRK
jgi:hypothetical protein